MQIPFPYYANSVTFNSGVFKGIGGFPSKEQKNTKKKNPEEGSYTVCYGDGKKNQRN